ncbi:SusD/RagB family nutrient-binding outer membrane lipoprotein [Fodinibius sp. Rm-B-1B1-1]|uniref:SusD/RagB family nutrient-binding outer membrane lipoprotein n=1 Tax=Fodinibius alkaliphilus TaxID=3140241 RepID=UPI00315AE772
MRKLLLPLLVFALVLSSCEDDLTSLNDDPKAASEVTADPLFSNSLVSLGTLKTSVDYNINMFMFMSQYWAATTYADESQYNLTGRSIPDSYWSEVYRDVLNNLKRASSLVEEEEFTPAEEKAAMQAQIEVINVMAYHQLVTIFGDIPYSDALDADNVSPAYDNQAEIYSNLMSRLNSAISGLETAVNAGTPGFGSSADVFYAGSMEAWLMFANSLKMRMAIQVAETPGAVNFDPQTAIEEASPAAFQSNDDNLALEFTNTPPNRNPVWEDVINTGRNDFVAANTLIDMMNDLEDPRRQIQFTQVDTNTVEGDPAEMAYVGGIYGESNDYIDYSHVKGPLIESDFEGILLEYAEVEFIRAEANVRGWLTGTAAAAQDHYENAVTADMQYWSDASSDEEITQSEIDDYLDPLSGPAAYPATGTEREQIEAIAQQKWLGQYMNDNLQAWTDWRRLDHPTWFVADENPNADEEDDIPTRFTYPVDEQNLNQSNWSDAASAIGGDEQTTLLFWDVEYASSR